MILRERVPRKISLTGLLALGVLTLIALPGWSQNPLDEVPRPAAPSDVFNTPSPPPSPDSGEQRAKEPAERRAPTAGFPANNHSFSPQPPSRQGRSSDFAPSSASPETSARFSSARFGEAAPNGAEVVETKRFTLSRTTYKLPKDKAEKLAAFLESLEVRNVLIARPIEEDQVTVIASPEAQQAIGQFIWMLQSDSSEAGKDNPLWGLRPLKPTSKSLPTYQPKSPSFEEQRFEEPRSFP